MKCVLWFPNFESYGENLDRQKLLLQNFFEYLAIRILADALYEVRVILTMNNFRFSQLQVIIDAINNPFFAVSTASFAMEFFQEGIETGDH